MSSIDERLEGMDTLFLKCEHTRRLMTVSSLWTFDHRLDDKSVYRLLDKLCSAYPRFARVPCRPSFFKTATWTVPIGWSPPNNVVLHTLNKPTTHALQHYCSQQMALPLDYAKPLWELHAISGLKGDQCAFFWKAHHVMSDGQGFIRSILSTTSIEATLQRLEQQSLRQGKPKQVVPRYSNRWPYFIMKIFSFVWMVISHIYVYWMTWIHDLWVVLLCMVPLRRNDLMYDGLQSFEKEMSWSEDILMSDIRLVRKIFGGTLNDVMVAVITRCIKDYLEKNGRRQDNYLRLVIPVSLRQPNDWKCHNVVSCNWGFFSMGNEDTKELIKQVRREMKAIKTSFLPKLMYYWISFIWGYMPGITPPRWMYDYVCDIPHGVFTNLPGPTSPISFAGHEVQNYRTFPPQVGKGSIGIALISYNGKVSIGAIADVTNRYPNLTQSVCQRFSKEFGFILHEAQMELSKCA